MESELLKLGVSAIAAWLATVVIKEAFSLLKHRYHPAKNGNGSRMAGEVAPEIYLSRFDKLDAKLDEFRSATVDIMKRQTEILSDIRDWVIRQG